MSIEVRWFPVSGFLSSSNRATLHWQGEELLKGASICLSTQAGPRMKALLRAKNQMLTCSTHDDTKQSFQIAQSVQVLNIYCPANFMGHWCKHIPMNDENMAEEPCSQAALLYQPRSDKTFVQHKHPAGCGIVRVVVQVLIQKCKPSQYFCLFDDVFLGSRILSLLKPNLPKPKRQRKIRRRFCPGLSSTFMRPVSSRLAQFFAQVSTRGVFPTPLPSANHTTNR